ncbi:hypothetical protein B5X24_HaOG201919 [Helicoverpa armigera]|nr:hypothetical protein B5X24_HaOG201919 [Helicoverpa armigera]
MTLMSRERHLEVGLPLLVRGSDGAARSARVRASCRPQRASAAAAGGVYTRRLHPPERPERLERLGGCAPVRPVRCELQHTTPLIYYSAL